jgi:hypothetical protein
MLVSTLFCPSKWGFKTPESNIRKELSVRGTAASITELGTAVETVGISTSSAENESRTTSCSFGLSATSQQYFSLRTNQSSATSQQYFSLRTN